MKREKEMIGTTKSVQRQLKREMKLQRNYCSRTPKNILEKEKLKKTVQEEKETKGESKIKRIGG